MGEKSRLADLMLSTRKGFLSQSCLKMEQTTLRKRKLCPPGDTAEVGALLDRQAEKRWLHLFVYKNGFP